MITVVVGKEIEKIKGDFESYLNGLNMVGEISYSQYSDLYDEGTKQIQKAYELGKAELEKENAELKEQNKNLQVMLQAEREVRVNEDYLKKITDLEAENEELKEALKNDKVCKCSHYFNFKDLEAELTKAKDLLAKWVELYKPKGGNIPPTPIQVDTEQFISEV